MTVAVAHPAERSARVLLAAHAGLVLFSTLAMVTILAGEFPSWMQGPYTATVYRLGWQFSGQAYVVLGAAAVLLFSASRLGAARSLALFVVASGIALLSELGGTNVGLPFGPYRYTEMLGYRIAGDVPYPIPVSWYYMLFGSLAICARTMRADDDAPRTRWRWALVAGAVLTAWDVAMEVQMTNVQPAHWVWELDRVPAWVPDWLGGPLVHGMPLSNWIGWYVTGVVIARVMLAIVPPTRWRERIAPAALPVLVYAVNAVMPVATVARHGYWLVALAGLVAMGLPVWRARRGLGPTPTHP